MSNLLLSGPRPMIGLAAEIVAAYISRNSVRSVDLPDLIASVHAALTGLGGVDRPAVALGSAIERPSATLIRRSIQPEALISFIDGKGYKTLKRHLTSHGLDPRGYRERFGLPSDYPMVASDYAARRSALAKAIGLGRPGAMAERQSRRSRQAA